MAVKQGRAQAFLQPANLSADRRLAEPQRIAGMGQAAGVGDRVEDSEFVPVQQDQIFRFGASKRPCVYLGQKVFAIKQSFADKGVKVSNCDLKNHV